MKRFNALYYPETVCLSETELKTLVLLYDKIYFLPLDIQINPEFSSISSRYTINDSILAGAFRSKEDAHYSIMYGSEKHIWDEKLKRLMDLYDFLEEKKIVIPLKNSKFGSAYDFHPLQRCVDSDLSDKKFLYHCEQYLNEKIHVPRGPEEANIKIKGFLIRPSQYKRELAIFAICSERINSTLYFASSNDLIPTTNQEFYIKLYGQKFKRIIKNRSFQKDRQLLDQKKKFMFSILSWNICNEIVPVNMIEEKSVDHILKYKKETLELQGNFRKSLNSLQLLADKEPWEEKFLVELDKIVKLELVPEAERIKEAKRMIWKKLFHEAVKTAFSSKLLIPTFGLHLIPNISYLDLMYYTYSLARGDVT